MVEQADHGDEKEPESLGLDSDPAMRAHFKAVMDAHCGLPPQDPDPASALQEALEWVRRELEKNKPHQNEHH